MNNIKYCLLKLLLRLFIIPTILLYLFYKVYDFLNPYEKLKVFSEYYNIKLDNN